MSQTTSRAERERSARRCGLILGAKWPINGRKQGALGRILITGAKGGALQPEPCALKGRIKLPCLFDHGMAEFRLFQMVCQQHAAVHQR